MDTAQLLSARANKDEFFGTAPQGPLDEATRAAFDGLAYYAPNSDLVFDLPVSPGDRSQIQVQTSDDDVRVYEKAGTVTFQIEGAPVSLTLYDTGHSGYFVPFRDATSGTETYGAGRYLDIEPNADGTITLDFNLAYNPFCAYNDAYSCPLPPVENWLRVPVRAGEKAYES